MQQEREAMDAELQQVFPAAEPELFYQIGQMVGEERADRPQTSLLQAVGKILWQSLSPKEQEVFRDHFPHVTSQPYSGPIVPPISPEELAQYEAEQLAGIVTPTHRAPMTHMGYIEELEEVHWLPLDGGSGASFENHPLRDKLRDRNGRRRGLTRPTVLPPFEAPLMTFLSSVILSARETPPWTTLLVFVSEPFTVETVLGWKSLPTYAEERVRYFMGYIRDELEPTPMPDWVKSRGKPRPEPHRKRRMVVLPVPAKPGGPVPEDVPVK
jgi:hypothetical protein